MGPCCILSQWFGFHLPAKGKGYNKKGTGVKQRKMLSFKKKLEKNREKGSFSNKTPVPGIYMAGFGYTTGATTLSSSSSI